MASGPENKFIRSLNSKLPREVYAEKMHNPYRGGTFDCWYSSLAGDMWVEYKWIPSTPKTAFVVPELSALQKAWGRGRFEEGRKVRVIVGCPDGGVIFETPDLWEVGVSAKDFRERILTKPAIVAWLVEETTGRTIDVSNSTLSKHSKRKLVGL